MIKKILKKSYLNGLLVSFNKIRNKAHTGKYKSRGVIILRLDLIGDCTMFTSTALAIRKLYTGRKMTVVCLALTKPVFERLGVFDEIITVDFRPERIEYKKLLLLFEKLREKEYDILLQPQVSKMPVADLIASAVKCNERITIETKPGNSSPRWIAFANSLYDKIIPYPRGWMNEMDYYGAFVRGLGVNDYQTTKPFLPTKKQHFIEGKYYVFYPGASWIQRAWPQKEFAHLADYIYKKTGLFCAILGTGNENWIAEKIMENADSATYYSFINLAGKTSLEDVIDIIGGAEFIIANDTSGAHIGAAVNTPTIAIVGGGHYMRFLPYHIECIKKGDRLPIAVNYDMPCYYCEWNWDIIGQRNKECLRRMQQVETLECIEKISFRKVIRELDKILRDKYGTLS